MSEPIHIISLGAGVQSSTMALMAACGQIKPMPTAAVFADTQAEPASVYRWLEWLEQQLPFALHCVTRGSLTDVSLQIRHKKDGSGSWAKSLIPAYVKNPNGTKGIMGRACTADFKVAMIIKQARGMIDKHVFKSWKEAHAPALKLWRAYQKEKVLAKKQKRQPALSFPSLAWNSMQAEPLVVQWIGISLDEAQRAKPARDPWIRHRWPMLDAGMKRYDCLRWMESKGFPRPPRSACIYCPFHSDAEWRRLRDEEPEEWARAVKFERDLQAVKAKTDNMGGVPFLHDSLRPLDSVDLSTDAERGQGLLWGNECEGMCGV